MAEPETSTGLQRYRETALAFDDLIVQVGRAVSRAQEALDRRQSDFQRQVAAALQAGTLRRLDVPPVSAYTLPETKLELKIGLSMSAPEGGGPPRVDAVPLNATTTNQSDIDVEAATEVKLRFVSVPPSEEPPGSPPSALTPDEARALAGEPPWLSRWLAALTGVTALTDFVEDERLWLASWLAAREPVAVALIDDRRGERVAVFAGLQRPGDETLAPVGSPRIRRIDPVSGLRGDLVTLHGEDFLTLGGQTAVRVDGRPVPAMRLSMGAVSFKVPGWAVRGDVEVETALGTTGDAGRGLFLPLPTFESFEPRRGVYDSHRRRGTWISVTGHNLRSGCTLRFAGGAVSESVEVLSPSRLQAQVPEGAGSGPLTLVFGEHEQTLPEPFFLLPRVERVSPRQARVGEEVAVTGDALAEVAEIAVGAATVPRTDFTLHTGTEIRFRVPPGATDGPLRLRTVSGGLPGEEAGEVASRDLFYVVPRIIGFAQPVVTRGQLLTIRGEGLDPDPEMMTLLFDAEGGLAEAPVLAVAADRGSLTTRVPMEAVTGYVLLLRKRVYSEVSAEDTSDRSANKLTVLGPDGDTSDLLLEERFDGDLSRWSSEAGSWRIEDGLLASEGTSRLGFAPAAPEERLSLYAEVLRAERFGFALLPEDGGDRLQAWVDLASSSPALTWSTVDPRGKQTLLGGVPLAVLAGGDHLAQLRLGDGTVTLRLDQEDVHSQEWAAAVQRVALLADSPTQRWDNVVLLRTDTLALPAPELYRFGSVPPPPQPPSLQITSLAPTRGPEGTEVTVEGIGLDGAARFFLGGVEAEVREATGDRATVVVPSGARSGPLEVHGRGGAVVTSTERFVVPPEILDLVPSRVLAGESVAVIGSNLPSLDEEVEVRVLEQQARVLAVSSTMLTVQVPAVVGTGPVSLRSEGFTALAPGPLEVRREEVVLDLIEEAGEARWATLAGEVALGAPGEAGDAAVQRRERERLEDGRDHGPVLYLRPPSPSLHSLRGAYPVGPLPSGPLELRIAFGVLATAEPAPDEAAEADGVVFEMGFLPTGSAEEVTLLPRVACIHDGSLELFVLDAGSLAGQEGELIVAVYPGRTGLRDEAALATAALVAVS